MRQKSSPSVTADMAAHIKYLKQTLGLYNHQIAAIFGINQGRVSEIMTGKRYPGIEPKPF